MKDESSVKVKIMFTLVNKVRGKNKLERLKSFADVSKRSKILIDRLK